MSSTGQEDSLGLVFLFHEASHSSWSVPRRLSPPSPKSMGWNGRVLGGLDSQEFHSSASEQVRRLVWCGGVQLLSGAIAGVSEASRSREMAWHS